MEQRARRKKNGGEIRSAAGAAKKSRRRVGESTPLLLRITGSSGAQNWCAISATTCCWSFLQACALLVLPGEAVRSHWLLPIMSP